MDTSGLESYKTTAFPSLTEKLNELTNTSSMVSEGEVNQSIGNLKKPQQSQVSEDREKPKGPQQIPKGAEPQLPGPAPNTMKIPICMLR